MAVYVDDMRASYTSRKGQRYVMCHMIADTRQELLEMAKKLGLAQRWLQSQGTTHEHFDVTLSKRRLAVRAGAVQITKRAMAQRCNDRVDEEGCYDSHDTYFGVPEPTQLF